MTCQPSAHPFGNCLPTDHERQLASELHGLLAGQKPGEAILQVPVLKAMEQVEVTLTPALHDLFLELVRHIAGGDAVAVVPIHQIMTTQQAADLLNVSRPHLIKLLEAGNIPFTTVGRHRRIKAEDVFQYRVAHNHNRSNALHKPIGDGPDLL